MASSPHLADVLDEGAMLVREGVEFLEWITSEVGTHIPDFDFDLDNALEGVRSHLPDVTAHLPDFDVRGKISSTFDDARARFNHFDLSLPDPQEYAIALQNRLSLIRSHLLAISLPSPNDITLATPKVLTDLLPDLLDNAGETEEPSQVPERERQVAHALKMSCNGTQLITYDNLPAKWRNNEFVLTGYRFIPLSSWKSLLFSTFTMHNETSNIHTHLLPLLFIISFILPLLPLPSGLSLYFSWAFGLYIPRFFSLSVTAVTIDATPQYLFLGAACACLACSSLWHLSVGCADVRVLENGARTDYAGIGWLISASVATSVYYGFACHPGWMMLYLCVSVITGTAGSIAPFQSWFDERKNKMKRIAFFITLASSGILPVMHMISMKGMSETVSLLAPLGPVVLSYLGGLVFYATHFPECVWPGKFDLGGSHAIWHVFIVLAIRLNWRAVQLWQLLAAGNTCSA